MRALVFLLVLGGLAFVGYRFWNPNAEASGTESGEEPAQRSLNLSGGGSLNLSGGGANGDSGRDGPASAGPGGIELVSNREAARLADEGRWSELVASWEENDFLFSVAGKRLAQRLLEHCRSADCSDEDATLLLSAALDAGTRGAPYLADAAVRDLFARLYQAQQDALGRSLVNPRGSWRSRLHKVRSGEVLGGLARKLGKQVGSPLSPGLLMMINGISDPKKLRAGDSLRVPVDPMHVSVERATHTLKLFLGPVLLRIYPVGLGKKGRSETPKTEFTVVELLKDPAWTHPETGRYYPPGAPGNALGGYFVKLESSDPGLTGFGIHGTDDPSSIGRNESLGCIRLRPGDITELFTLLARKVPVRVR